MTSEYNVLVNPDLPDFPFLQVLGAEPFVIDTRLLVE